jgi:nitroreductase
MSVLETIKVRKSCRRYSKTAIEAPIMKQIEKMLEKPFSGPFGYSVKFHTFELKDISEKAKSTLGAYGMVRGANMFIGGATDNTQEALIDLAYSLEKVILDLTELKIATCWLGGLYQKELVMNYFKKEFNMKENQIVPCTTPIGYAEKPSFLDHAIKGIMHTDQRKPWSELFFSSADGAALNEIGAGKYKDALEAVRLAPSANNGQPWRIVMQNGVFHFMQKDGYTLDMGIAMLHFELVAKESGLVGAWKKLDNVKCLQDTKYIISWEIL